MRLDLTKIRYRLVRKKETTQPLVGSEPLNDEIISLMKSPKAY